MEETKNRPAKKDILALLMIVAVLAVLFAFKGRLPERSVAQDVKTVAESCSAIQNKETCYAKAFENLTKETDMRYAFEVLRELQDKDRQARGCHFIAHSISTAETRKDTSKWRDIMNSAPQDCSYGAAHGALEVYASTFPDGKLPKDEIPRLCNNPDTNNCTHALGHLLLVLNENHIPESLKNCEALPHGEFGIFECLTGVFMERLTAFNLVTHGLATEESLNWPKMLPEFEKVCREQSGAYSVACWKEIVHAVLVTVRNDPQKLVDFCETAPGEKETRECIDHALGIIASSYNFELSKMHPICETSVKASDFKDRCYAHLVSSTLSTVPGEMPAAKRFCSSIDKEYQASCFKMIDNINQFKIRSGN